MKVSNETIDNILSVGTIFSKDDPGEIQRLLKDLAADLKEARENKRQVVRVPMPVIGANVTHSVRVETAAQLRMSVPEPYATMVEMRSRAAASQGVGEPSAFPLVLVPRSGLWILQLHDLRRPVGEPDTAICRASTMEELSDLIARERAPKPCHGEWGVKPFKIDGPLGWYASPSSTDCFVNVMESTDTYIAHAIAGLKEARAL